jgi:hypothetical protein
MWDVNLQCWILSERMEGSVMMLLFRIVFWMYVCVQGELPLCALPSDGSTTNKENMRNAICVSTSIYLVYVRIPGKGISMCWLAYI